MFKSLWGSAGGAVGFAGGLDFHMERGSGGPHRLDERLHPEDDDHPLQVVGENVKAHLALTFSRVRSLKWVAPIHALMVPNGCSAVWRRMRMVLGARSNRSCIASSTASCS
jgi:hypothetical protein